MKTFLIFFCLVFAYNTYAGTDSHGGYGIQVNKSFYLYDLFEAGIEETASIGPQLTDDHNIKKNLKHLGFEEAVESGVAQKLNHLLRVMPLLGRQIYNEILSYQWRFVANQIADSNDIGWTPLVFSGNKLIPLAVRKETSRVVTIRRDLFSKLDTTHKVALVFHESIASIDKKQNEDDPKLRDSYLARQIVGLIFSPHFSIDSKFQLYNLMIQSGYFESNYTYLTYEDFNWILGDKCDKYSESLLDQISDFLRQFDSYASKFENSLPTVDEYGCNSFVRWYEPIDRRDNVQFCSKFIFKKIYFKDQWYSFFNDYSNGRNITNKVLYTSHLICEEPNHCRNIEFLNSEEKSQLASSLSRLQKSINYFMRFKAEDSEKRKRYACLALQWKDTESIHNTYHGTPMNLDEYLTLFSKMPGFKDSPKATPMQNNSSKKKR